MSATSTTASPSAAVGRPLFPRLPGSAALKVALYLGACWSVIALLATGLGPWGPWLVAALAAYTTVPLVVLLAWRGWPFYPTGAFRLLVMRPFWYTQLLLPLVAGAGAIGLAIGLPFGRTLAPGQALASAVAAALGLLLAAGYVGSRRLAIRQVTASVPGLPAALDGLRIVQISDLHVGPHTSRKFLAQVTAAVHALAPDLIAVTGDLVDDRPEDVAAYAAGLGELSAPLGVYAIPGNHDVYAGWADVERELRAGVRARVLVNEVQLVQRGGATLAIVGTGDPAARHGPDAHAAPDITRALAQVPADTVVVALAHNPALWPALAARGVSLTLSGHTHWGQLALPQLGWSLASPFLRHAMGAYAEGNALLYVHPGTGYWGIPFRFGVVPEVALVTLSAGRTAAIAVGEQTRAPGS